MVNLLIDDTSFSSLLDIRLLIVQVSESNLIELLLVFEISDHIGKLLDNSIVLNFLLSSSLISKIFKFLL